MENRTENPARKAAKLEIVVGVAGLISLLASIFLISDWMPPVLQIIFRGGNIVVGVIGLIIGGLSINSFKPVVALNATTAIGFIIGVIGKLIVGLLIGLFTGGLFNLGLDIGAFIPWYSEKENKGVENDHKLTKSGMQCCALGILFTVIGLLIHQLFPGLWM